MKRLILLGMATALGLVMLPTPGHPDRDVYEPCRVGDGGSM